MYLIFKGYAYFLQLSAVEKHEATRFMSIIYEMVDALNERNEKRDEPAHNLE